MSHSVAPCESPPPIMTPGLTKGNKLPHLRASSSFRLTLQCFRFSPGFPESCTIPKQSRILAFAILSRTYKPMPDGGAICLDPQHISKTTNKRAPGSYLNKGSIVRVWREAPFSTHSPVPVLSAYGLNYPPHSRNKAKHTRPTTASAPSFCESLLPHLPTISIIHCVF